MRRSLAVFSLSLILLSRVFPGAMETVAAEVEHRNPPLLPEGLPFSAAVRVDDTLYLSGQLGTRDGAMAVVEGGISAEARQTMENIRTLLAANDLSMNDVVKCTVMLADISEWGAFNEVYRTFFDAPYPARSAFATTGLALNARVEVECMAVYAE